MLFLLAAGPRAASADGLDAETRRAAEQAFFEGRLEDLDGLLGAARGEAERLPLTLRDRWWRGPVAADVDVDALLRVGGPEGGGRLYPLLLALVRDRMRREADGAAGLPAEGPLEAYWQAHRDAMDAQQAEAFRWADAMMVRCYEGDDDPREVLRLDRRARDLRNKAMLVWLAALGAFVASSFIGILVVGRRRDD